MTSNFKLNYDHLFYCEVKKRLEIHTGKRVETIYMNRQLNKRTKYMILNM